ncbi:MAG: RtcB family protein [Leptolinea sp.]|jgi:tRNA-splicing ligase RtcB|nr:RtcB family protein [Leptolinea sp.]
MQIISTERIPIKLWATQIDAVAMQQVRNLANLPFAFRWVAIMPDAHTGYGMPIGGVLATREMVIPNAVGVDIGCGMAAVRTSLTKISQDELHEILAIIRSVIPVGFKHHPDAQPWDGFDRAPDIRIIQEELFSARHQLGTLGGGNHFIELQQGDDGFIWLMIHSGSRNFGLKAAREYHLQAKILSARGKISLPDSDLSYLPVDSAQGQEYLTAMNYCLDFARANRALMVERSLQAITAITGGVGTYSVNIHHNYAAVESHFGHEVLVHRKGATSARQGQAGIIPGSMGAHSYITEGLGNEESFQSSSHGAGRRMGRNEATRKLDLEVELQKMKGILHGMRSRRELEEAPGAYKDIDEVMEQQSDLVKVITRLWPLAVIKG